ncbi:MAG: hypothetical protein ACFFD4_04225 [Candidatus Odinarchaeota archaeon]
MRDERRIAPDFSRRSQQKTQRGKKENFIEQNTDVPSLSNFWSAGNRRYHLTLQLVIDSTYQSDYRTAVAVLSRNAPWTGYRRGAPAGDGDRWSFKQWRYSTTHRQT